METLRRPFTPDDEYVVSKRMIVDNTAFAPDPSKLFDKRLVSGRLLRQLYEQGYLEHASREKIKPVGVPAESGRRRRFRDGAP